MRKRREKFDNRRRVDFTDTQADFLDSQADENRSSFMAVVRKAVDEYMKALSLNEDTKNTSNMGTNSDRTKVLPDGAYTAEQVAQLINAMRPK